MNELGTLTSEVQALVGAGQDGVWGPKSAKLVLARLHSLGGLGGAAGTAAATAEAIRNPQSAIRNDFILDDRSRTNIETLTANLQPIAIHFLQLLHAAGINAKVISGTRTYEEQDVLYEQGRSRPGKIVTHARAGHSNHNFGVAFDIGIWDERGRYLDDSSLYGNAGQVGKTLGLSWGGDWHSIQDQPHFELRPKWAESWSEGAMLTEFRRRHTAGEALV